MLLTRIPSALSYDWSTLVKLMAGSMKYILWSSRKWGFDTGMSVHSYFNSNGNCSRFVNNLLHLLRYEVHYEKNPHLSVCWNHKISQRGKYDLLIKSFFTNSTHWVTCILLHVSLLRTCCELVSVNMVLGENNILRLPFFMQHIQMHFREWQYMNCD